LSALEKNQARIYGVVPAAGCGQRMVGLGADRAKVLLHLDGCGSILEMTLRALRQAEVLCGVVVAAREEDLREISEAARQTCPGLDVLVVPGGETRQASVFSALSAIAGRATHVLVHDAARPFCAVELIRQTAGYCVQNGACILAVPAKCTLKMVEDKTINKTIPRCCMWEAQTPQAFSFELLYEAHKKALADGYIGTDDSELVERLGHRVQILEGSDANIKITTPHDLQCAALMVGSKSS
jgi:2-C-methyl-D-erythritol 4-phosphate cytidylyltransferase